MASGDAVSGFSQEAAWGAFKAACRVVGVRAEGAELHRPGAVTVVRLAGGEGLVRVVPESPRTLSGARRAVRVSRWLDDVGFPAVKLLRGTWGAVSADGYVVTFWEPVATAERAANAGQFGDLVRRLHWLEEPAELGLVRLEPLGEARELLAACDGLTAEDRSFLQRRAATLGKRYDDLDFVLPPGLVHGDAWVGSAPLDAQGRVVLTGLEGFAVGPREWDLALTALSFDRYGWHTRCEYDAFVQAYGFDVRNWYGYETLADLHELISTVRLAAAVTPRAASEPESVELARRLADLRAGADRHGWRRF